MRLYEPEIETVSFLRPIFERDDARRCRVIIHEGQLTYARKGSEDCGSGRVVA
jgi:hypothetical protein